LISLNVVSGEHCAIVAHFEDTHYVP